MRAADGVDCIPNFAQVLLIINHWATGVEIFFYPDQGSVRQPDHLGDLTQVG